MIVEGGGVDGGDENGRVGERGEEGESGGGGDEVELWRGDGLATGWKESLAQY